MIRDAFLSYALAAEPVMGMAATIAAPFVAMLAVAVAVNAYERRMVRRAARRLFGL